MQWRSNNAYVFGCESTFWETRGFARGFGMLHQVVIASRWIWHWTSIGWGPWGVNQGWSTFPQYQGEPWSDCMNEPSIFVHFLGGFGVPQVWPKTQLMVVGDCSRNFWVIFKPFGWLGSFKGWPLDWLASGSTKSLTSWPHARLTTSLWNWKNDRMWNASGNSMKKGLVHLVLLIW